MKSKSVLTQIAKHAGVSKTYASFVINNNEKQLARMKPETIERVRKTAEELGYHRNELFAAVRRGHSRFLALLARDVSQEYFARAIEKIMDATAEHGYSQKLFKLKYESEIPTTVTRLQEYRIRGGVFFSIQKPIIEKFWTDLADTSFNSLLIHCDPKSIPNSVPVLVADKSAMKLATEHMQSLGHRRIAYAGPTNPGFAHITRKNAFETVLKNSGLPAGANSVLSFAWDMSDHCTAIVDALKSKQRPTTIICYSDLAAMIVFRIAATLSLRIPQDLSVIGFDDDSFAQLIFPSLTTFRQDLSVIQEKYVPELIESIETGTPLNRRKKRLIPVTLIERESTGPAPKK